MVIVYLYTNNTTPITMTEQAIELLRRQATMLDARDFDLRIWKKQTYLLLERIFGESDPKAREINSLEYEFNSWSLRDASGNESYEAGFKKTGRAVLELAIAELESFGMPEKEKNEGIATLAGQILSLVFDEMKGSQVKGIRALLDMDLSAEEKRRRLKEELQSIDRDNLAEIISGILILGVYNEKIT